MKYVYEFMTQTEKLPTAGSDFFKDMALTNQRVGQMFNGMIEAMEKRLALELDVVSHAQMVVGDRVVTTMLVRRSADSVDPRRN